MNTDFLKRYYFVCGMVFLFAGCLALMLFILILLTNMPVNIGVIVGILCILAFVAMAFYISINSFIKYGVALGIDYALEQQET